LSILLINAVTAIQRQVTRADGKASQLTDEGEEKKSNIPELLDVLAHLTATGN